MNAVRLIAKGVLIEAVRRREVYAIVLVSVLLIAATMMIDFFDIEGLVKFHREIALKIMAVATALAVIVLATRQLPREFEMRTIYPLLAKPVSRASFLAGKLLGVLLAAFFCFLLFMGVYVAGSWHLGTGIPWGIFVQYVYLQLVQMAILATLGFLLSVVLNLDAAITLSVLFYATASVMITAISMLYDLADPLGQRLLLFFNYAIPQLALFDLSEKAVHAGDGVWDPLPLVTMLKLTAYGGFFCALYFALALVGFRRKPL